MSNRKEIILPALLFVVIALLSISVCANSITIPNDQVGDRTGSIVWDGLERTYLIHIPSSYDRTKSMPLVIVLHGGLGSGEAMVRLTLAGFNTLADQEGFIVVYPDGIGKHWNDGREGVNDRAHRENIDDIGFLSALIEHLIRELSIDQRHVYVTGISNGAGMSYRLACELSEKIAAIAPVALSMPVHIVAQCSPSRPISVLLMHGTKDPLAPYEGGWVDGGRGKVLSVTETVAYWVSHNNCSSSARITWEPDKDPRDGTRVRREVYGKGQEGTEVILYAIEDGGHIWPGGWQYLPQRIVGKPTRDIDANEVIWNFFKKHAVE